jgi:hypothetical protein
LRVTHRRGTAARVAPANLDRGKFSLGLPHGRTRDNLGETLPPDVADRHPPGEHARPHLAGRGDRDLAVPARPAQLAGIWGGVADAAAHLPQPVAPEVGDAERP